MKKKLELKEHKHNLRYVPIGLAYFKFFYSIKWEANQTDFQEALDKKNCLIFMSKIHR
jgi:hypothetical protein